MLAGLLAVVLAGLIVFWVVNAGEDASDRTATPTSSPETSAEPTEDPDEGTAEGTAEEEQPATSEPTAPTEEEQPAEDPAAAARDFFASVPGDLPTAYQRTSPRFQAEFPYEQRFAFFWSQFSGVEIANVENESDTTALVDITYVEPDGSRDTERHRLTFVRGDDGRLLLDSDVAV